MTKSLLTRAKNRAIKIVKGVVTGAISFFLYIPFSFLWFSFLPSHSCQSMDAAPLTYHAGVVTGIGVMIFAPIAMYFAWQGINSIYKSL